MSSLKKAADLARLGVAVALHAALRKVVPLQPGAPIKKCLRCQKIDSLEADNARLRDELRVLEMGTSNASLEAMKLRLAELQARNEEQEQTIDTLRAQLAGRGLA